MTAGSSTAGPHPHGVGTDPGFSQALQLAMDHWRTMRRLATVAVASPEVVTPQPVVTSEPFIPGPGALEAEESPGSHQG